MSITQTRWRDQATQDVRNALRTLRASPATTVSVVLTLALGIGGVTTMYGLASWLLLQPPAHVAEPEQVRRIFFQREEPGTPGTMGSTWYACVHDRLQSEAVTLQHAAAYTAFDVSIGAGADAARVRAAVVSAGFWSTLGTQAAIGRLFADEEATPGATHRAAILGHAFWQQQFGGDRAVIGRTLRVRGEPFEIIGVTPRGFRGVDRYDVDLWLPLSAYPLSGRSLQTDTDLSHVVRLAPRVTTAQADADLSRVLSDVVDDDAGCERRGTASAARLLVTTGSLARGLGSDMRLIPEARVSVWLVGVAFALLAIACSNVASLLLLRALARRREIAIRLALGMSMRRLASQLFMESGTLAVLGGLASVAVVEWPGAWMNRVLLPNLLGERAQTVDPWMVALTALCVCGAAFLAGLAPLLQAPRDTLTALQEGVARATTRRSRLHRTLLVAQTTLSVVLLIGAGLFLRSLQNIRSLDLGFDPDNVLVATVDFAGRAPREVAAFYERALERIQALPGVEQASLAMSVPLRSARAGSIRPIGRPERLTSSGGDATYVNHVAPGFLPPRERGSSKGASSFRTKGMAPRSSW